MFNSCGKMMDWQNASNYVTVCIIVERDADYGGFSKPLQEIVVQGMGN